MDSDEDGDDKDMSMSEESEDDLEENEAPTAVPITDDGPSTSSAKPVEDEYAYDSSDEEVCSTM